MKRFGCPPETLPRASPSITIDKNMKKSKKTEAGPLLAFQGAGDEFSCRDRRSPVFAEQGNSSRETSLTRKGDILWDSVHLSIRFRSFSSMSFSLSERRPWPTGSEHKITTPQEEATRRLLGRGEDELFLPPSCSSPLRKSQRMAFSLSSPLWSRDLISRPPRNRTLSRGGLLPGRSSGFRHRLSRRFLTRRFTPQIAPLSCGR